jgi:hypothetical protein
MAAIAVVLGLCCCSSLSAAGGWFGGFIPGTEPHFKKEMNTTEWKEIVDELKVRTEKIREDVGDLAEKAGPDLSGLSDEERTEYIDKSKKYMQELRESETCEKVKELLDGNKFKDTLSAYPDDIFTLSGSKRKHEVWEDAIGLDDDFPKRELDGTLEMCVATDEEFQKFIER